MRVETVRDIGLVIRERRQALGLSQTALAAQAAVGRQWLVALEGGKARADIALILRVAKTLGLRVSLEPVLPQEGETAPPRRARIDLARVLARYKAPAHD